jgi:hypothetical protein
MTYVLRTALAKAESLREAASATGITSATLVRFAAIVKISDQQTEDFNLKPNPQMNNMWGFPKERGEDEAIKELRFWWNANREKCTVADTTQPTTVPTRAPAKAP